MNRCRPFVLPVLILGLLTLCCAPLPRTGHIPVEHQKIYVMPVRDKMSIEKFEGFPEESARAQIVKKPFSTLRENILIEVRRCEKFGAYTTTSDSTAASVLITPTLGPHTYLSDTLSIPLQFDVFFRDGKRRFVREITHSVTYHWDTEPKSTYHLLGTLTSEYVRTFPYDTLSAALYDPSAPRVLPK